MKIVYYNHKKNNRRWIKIAIFALSAVAGIWSFFWLPYFKISQIEIKNPLVNKREVEDRLDLYLSSLTSFLLPKNNFFLFESKIAENAILKSGLGVTEIQKKFPNKIFVDFLEIKPKFLYCKKEECFYIDKNGIPYETAPIFSESPLPILDTKKVLRLGEEILPKSEASFLIELEKEIENLEFSIKRIEIGKNLEIISNEGWKLILSSGKKDQKNIVEKLSLIFEQKIKDRSMLEYIDMRFPNKAYYKLK